MNTIKFGVWGFGRMGSRHGQYFALESDKLKLVSACDTDADRLAGARAEYQCAVYTDAQAFLADPEISYNVALPEPYCTIYGNRGSLVLNAAMDEIRLRYIAPDFLPPELCIEANTASYTNRYDQDIPWVEETLRVDPVGDMWEYIDRKLIRHLHETIRNGSPFPIQNHDAFETVRIMQTVKAQNPQFAWKQDEKQGTDPEISLDDMVSGQKLGLYTGQELRENGLELPFVEGYSPLKVIRMLPKGQNMPGWVEMYRTIPEGAKAK